MGTEPPLRINPDIATVAKDVVESNGGGADISEVASALAGLTVARQAYFDKNDPPKAEALKRGTQAVLGRAEKG